MDQRLADHFRALDAVAATVCAQLPAEGHAVSCAPGCAWCCRLVVDCGRLEAQAIAEYLRAAGLDTPVFRARLERSQRLMHTRGPRRYWRLQRACDLLGPDRRCLVYPVRPATCRLHVSVSTPEACSRMEGMQPSTLSDLRELHHRFCVATSEGLAATGWLPGMILRALVSLEALASVTPSGVPSAGGIDPLPP